MAGTIDVLIDVTRVVGGMRSEVVAAGMISNTGDWEGRSVLNDGQKNRNGVVEDEERG
jgi:hypothetical protein